jgi:hypothetical protein
MLTGEMLHKAYWEAKDGAHLSWSQLGDRLKAHYTAMAAYLNTALIATGAAERDALRSQINEMTDTILRVEQERDAFQQLASAKGGSDV